MKSKNLIFMFLLLTFCLPLLAQQMDDKWHRLMGLIEEEIKTIKSVGKLGSELRYRLLELSTEKIKLIREKENKAYLESSINSGTKINKESFFTESAALYAQIQQMGNEIIKSYPQSPIIPEVYFTLGLNERDYSKGKNSERYLLESLKLAGTKDLALKHKIRLALAEYYYNEKNYREATSYYNEILKNLNDEWLSRHYFNAAWCYFKTQNLDQGVEHLIRAFFLGRDKKYLPIEDQVLEALALFYVQARRVKEGAEFFIKNLTAPIPHLMKMAKHTAQKGLFDKTKYLLNLAFNDAINKNDHLSQIDIHHLELEIYRQFSKYDLFYESARKVVKLHQKFVLAPEIKEQIITKIKDLVGFLQIRLTKNAKVKVANFNALELNQIIDYFDFLRILDSDNEDQYLFFQGETFYAVSSFSKASKKYTDALDFSKKFSDRLELKRKILNSLLSIIGNSELNKKLNDQLTIYTYSNFLALWPKDDLAPTLYLRLFNKHFELTHIDDAINVITVYNQNYPNDLEKQRSMQSIIIDYFIAKEDTENLATWIAKLEAGYLAFNGEYVEKTILFLASILFNRYQEIEKKDPKGAITGYESIYNHPKYPQKIKGQAALNVSILKLGVQNEEESFKWMGEAFKLIPDKEMLAQSKKILILSNQYALRQRFDYAIELSNRYLTRFCSSSFATKDQMISRLNMLTNYDNTDETSSFLHLNCLTEKKVVKEIILARFSHAFKFSDIKELAALLGEPDFLLIVDDAYELLLSTFWYNFENKSSPQSIHYFVFLNTLKAKFTPKQEYIKFLEDIKTFEAYVEKSSAIQFTFSKRDVFDENVFGNEFNDSVNKLKELTNMTNGLNKLGRANLNLYAMKILITKISELKTAVENILPSGVDADYIAAFKEQINPFIQELEQKIQETKIRGQKTIAKQDIFSMINPFYNQKDEPEKVEFNASIYLLLSSPLGGDR